MEIEVKQGLEESPYIGTESGMARKRLRRVALWMNTHWLELALLALVLAYAAVLRLGQVNARMSPGDMAGDLLKYYYTPARNLLEGRGFFQNDSDINSPLQAVFFAVSMLMKRSLDLLLMQRMQVVIALAGLVGAWVWARMTAGRAAALVFVACLAVFDQLVHTTPILGTESNYVSLFFMTMAVCQLLLRRPGASGLAAGAGMALALTSLQRFNAILLMPLMAGLVGLQGWRMGVTRRGLVSSAVLTAVFCVPLGAWWMRNFQVYDRFVPTIPRSGSVLHVANHGTLDNAETPYWEDWYYSWGWMDQSIEQYMRRTRYSSLFEPLVVYNNLYQEKVQEYVKQHPAHAFRNFAVRWGDQFILPTSDVAEVKVRSSWWPGFLAGLQRLSVWMILPGLLLYVWRRGHEVAAWNPVVVFGYLVFFGALFHITKDGRMNLLLKCLGFFWGAYFVGEVINSTILRHKVQPLQRSAER